MIWILLIIMTAGTLLPVFWPVLKQSRLSEDRLDGTAVHYHELEVYKDQMRALDRELSEGILSSPEYDSAKLEISRRLLASAQAIEQSAHPQKTVHRAGQEASLLFKYWKRHRSAKPSAFISILLAVCVLTLGLYAIVGSPRLPDHPSKVQIATTDNQKNMAAMMAKIEERLQAVPNDGKGWDVIAPVYLRQGKYHKADFAYRKAVKLLGESGDRLAALAETLTLKNKDTVTPVAAGLFRRALKLDPGLVNPRIRLAMMLEQKGALQKAAHAYQAIIKMSPQSAPWLAVTQRRLGFVNAHLKVSQSLTSAPLNTSNIGDQRQPTPQDIKAAEKMSPHEQDEMIQQMVANLAERLQENGQNLKGWLKLLNAYNVLGQKQNASKALGQARSIFAKDKGAMKQLTHSAKRLGL